MTDQEDLKSKAITGSIWSLIETFSIQIVQFIVGIILARILEPKDFGLIALTGIFTSISSALTDGGFEKTLIQKEHLTSIQISTVFYINIILGALIMSLLIILAPYISIFFNAPALTAILQVISFSILLNSFSQTQQTLLLKDLDFKKISRVRIYSSIVGGVTGLVLAFTGFGVWALVYSSLVPQIFRVIFYWIKSSWYPQFKFSLKSVKSLVPFGLNILGSSIFFFIIQQFNVFIVGKFYSKAELGLFNRGNKFPDLIVGIIETVVLKMSLPIFSKLQNSPSLLLHTVKRTNKIVAFISFPLLILLLLNAEEITIFLFSEKWRGSIIFLQMFCVVKLLEPFISIHRELLLAQGLSRLLLKLFTSLSLLEIILILLVIKYGIVYLVITTFICRIVQYITYTTINSRRLGSNLLKELEWYKPYFIITLIMTLIVLMSQYILRSFDILRNFNLNLALFLKITFQLSIGFITYIFLAFKFKIEEIVLVNSVFKLIMAKIKRQPKSISFY